MCRFGDLLHKLPEEKLGRFEQTMGQFGKVNKKVNVNFDIKKSIHIRKDFSYEIGLPIMWKSGLL